MFLYNVCVVLEVYINGTVSRKITLVIFFKTCKRKVTLSLKCIWLIISSVPYNFMMDSPILDV